MAFYNNNKYYTTLSALQKSVRWCEVNASRYFAKEFMQMGKTVDVLNRLVLIAAEDVGIADPSLVVYERERKNEFERLILQHGIEKKDAIKVPQIIEVVDRAAIAAAVSYKSRLLPMLSFLALHDIYNNKKFDLSLNDCLNRFLDSLDKSDERSALYYAFIVGIFYKQMNPILNVLREKSINRNTDLIKKWIDEYQIKKERLMLVGSIVLACRDLHYSHGGFRNLICQHQAVPIRKAVIPDRAYDKHTSIGKRRKRGLDHFFRQAATLRNERPFNDYEAEGKKVYLAAEKLDLGSAEQIIAATKEKLKTSGILNTVSK